MHISVLLHWHLLKSSCSYACLIDAQEVSIHTLVIVIFCFHWISYWDFVSEATVSFRLNADHCSKTAYFLLSLHSYITCLFISQRCSSNFISLSVDFNWSSYQIKLLALLGGVRTITCFIVFNILDQIKCFLFLRNDQSNSYMLLRFAFCCDSVLGDISCICEHRD